MRCTELDSAASLSLNGFNEEGGACSPKPPGGSGVRQLQLGMPWDVSQGPGLGLTYLSMTTAGVWVAMIAKVGAAHESRWVVGGCAALVRIGEW